MLKAYVFVNTNHQKLHNLVISFFDRIEHEAGQFRMELFETEFQPIVKRHKTILKDVFFDIYNEVQQWSQLERTQLCMGIRQSNDIEHICSRCVSPVQINSTQKGVYEKIRTLFLKLYSQVLDGKPVRDGFGVTLRQHFDAFRKANNDITICPMCGISELKTEYDVSREQYDHYLPQALYPFSAINFYNLVPICKDCNCPEVKGDKDILALTNGKLFYPYDPNHQGIKISFSIRQDSMDINSIEWQVALESPNGKDQEVYAWSKIYNIEERYLGFVKGRIEKWYKAYWEFLNDVESQKMAENDRRPIYLSALKADENEFLNIIRKPALLALLDGSKIDRAAREAKAYS